MIYYNWSIDLGGQRVQAGQRQLIASTCWPWYIESQHPPRWHQASLHDVSATGATGLLTALVPISCQLLCLPNWCACCRLVPYRVYIILPPIKQTRHIVCQPLLLFIFLLKVQYLHKIEGLKRIFEKRKKIIQNAKTQKGLEICQY